MLDILQEIWSSIRRNKLRTCLTGLAVSWGIFMLIVLLGAGNGLVHALMENSEGVSLNVIMAGTGRTSKPYDGLAAGRRFQFENRDMEKAETQLADRIEKAGALMYQQDVTLSNGDRYVVLSLNGVYPNYTEIEYRKMLAGRFINQVDIRLKRKVMVLNVKTAESLYGNSEEALGRFVKANDVMYHVVGVYKDNGNDFSIPAYIPLTTLQTIYNKGDKLNYILCTTKNLKSEKECDAFDEDFRKLMAANHRFDYKDENAMWINNRFTQNLQNQQATDILNIALWVIAIFTLLSGVVGVSNIMLITVKERTREFGIRKALGAKPRSILLLIVVESVLITAFFGYVGMVAGIGATEYLNVIAGGQVMDIGIGQVKVFSDPTVDIQVAIQATLTLVVAGTLAGLFPARKAVHIRPIEALRAE